MSLKFMLLLFLAILPMPSYATTYFTVSNGNIITPLGAVWHGYGVDGSTKETASGEAVAMTEMSSGPSGAPLTTAFSGVKFVRMPIRVYQAPETYAAFVSQLTALGIVIEFEDHPWPEQPPYTGAALTAETNWYALMASYYLGNPYVWFGTMNEPQAAAGMVAQQKAIINAIRGVGNNTIVLINELGGGNPGAIGAGGYGGNTLTDYLSFHSIAYDFHFYGWAVLALTDLGSFDSTQAQTNAALAGSVSSHSGIAALQSMKSADGVMPVFVGEYGNSTGGGTLDPNGYQIIDAVAASTQIAGAAAWNFDSNVASPCCDTLYHNGALVSPYGPQVAALIASHVSLPASGSIVNLLNFDSFLCVDVAVPQSTAGSLLLQRTCNMGYWSQQFLANQNSDGSYTLVNRNSGLCIDIPNGSNQSNIQLEQNKCFPTYWTQRWNIAVNDNGTFRLVNKNSGLCMAVEGSSVAANGIIVQETCNSSDKSQMFNLNVR